jgi:hypothetical protein
MLIQIVPSLPCGQFQASSSPTEELRLCCQQTKMAVLTTFKDGTWELLPVCRKHLAEVAPSKARKAWAATAPHQRVLPRLRSHPHRDRHQ